MVLGLFDRGCGGAASLYFSSHHVIVLDLDSGKSVGDIAILQGFMVSPSRPSWDGALSAMDAKAQ